VNEAGIGWGGQFIPITQFGHWVAAMAGQRQPIGFVPKLGILLKSNDRLLQYAAAAMARVPSQLISCVRDVFTYSMDVRRRHLPFPLTNSYAATAVPSSISLLTLKWGLGMRYSWLSCHYVAPFAGRIEITATEASQSCRMRMTSAKSEPLETASHPLLA